MLPQLNVSSCNEPARSTRIARGSTALMPTYKVGKTATTNATTGSFSGSDTGSVGQTSSASGKFEEAMEVYHQSMAIRRRKMSMSGNATMRSLDSNGGDSAEMSTVVQTSSSLRGPQLKPSTRLTRVDGSHVHSPLLLHPQQPPPHVTLPTTPTTTTQQQQQQQQGQGHGRSAYQLPSLVSHVSTANGSLSPSFGGAPPAPTSSASPSAAAAAQQHRRPSLISSRASGSATSVMRRSTRRPLSRHRPHTPLRATSAASSHNSAAGSWCHPMQPGGGDGGDGGGANGSSSASPSSMSYSRRGEPHHCRSTFLSSDAPLDDHEEMRGFESHDSVLGSMDHLVLHSPAQSTPTTTSTTTNAGQRSNAAASTTGRRPSTLASRGSSSAHKDTQAPPASHPLGTPRRVSSFTAVRSVSSQDASTGSYDVLGLDAVLMASSQEDLIVQRRSSLYQPTTPRSAFAPQAPPPPPPQAAAASPTTVNGASRPASAAAGGSSSCLGLTPTASPSCFVKQPAGAAAPAKTNATNTTAPAAAAGSASTPAAPSASASLSGASFGVLALRTPRHDTRSVTTATATTVAGTRSTSQNPLLLLGRSKADNAGRSASQAGLSSAVNNSASHTGSGATADTSRRDFVARASPPSVRRQSPSDTVAGGASTSAAAAAAAAASAASAPSSSSPSAAAAAAPRNPIDMLPQPGPIQPTDKQTAQFYNTASLAKTYDGSQFLNDYILLSEIGSGATGRVVLAFSTSRMCSVAIKIILKPRERKYRLQRVCDSSDSSPAVSNLSDKRGSLDSGGDGGAGGAVSPPVKGRSGSDAPTRNGGGSGVKGASSRSAAAAAEGGPSSGGGGGASSAAPRGRAQHLPARLTTAERMTRNLQREIDVMKDLNHPNIVRLYEVINDPKAKSLFLILQYVDSGAVAQLNSSGRIAAPFAPDDLLPIATQVIDGLVYLHEHRIIHRDIKPENILVNRDGQAFLADFGVAELMNAEAGLPTAATLAYQGTPLFMAPEIYAVDDDDDDGAGDGDGDVDVRHAKVEEKSVAGGSSPSSHSTRRPVNSHTRRRAKTSRTIDLYALDVWALGVTLYTLLVGHVPFQSMLQIRETVTKGVDIPAGVPPAWREVLTRTMAPDVDKRISSAGLKKLLHAMHDAHDKSERSANGTKDQQPQQRNGRSGRGGRARGGGGGGGGSGAPSRPAAAAAACHAWSRSEDEDVILGSGTPDETPISGQLGGGLDVDSDDVECSFSINSSVMDVLRPSRR